MRFNVIASCLLACLPSFCQAQVTRSIFDISKDPIELPDGKHQKSAELAGFTEILSTDDGHRVEIQTFSNLDRIDLSVRWDSGEEKLWNRISSVDMTLNGQNYVDVAEEYFSVINIHFDPWRRPGGNAFPIPGDSIVFQPGPEEFDSIVLLPCWDCEEPVPEAGNHAVFEYSIEKIPAPLAADFNYDDRVDFLDFLTLSTSFGFRPEDVTANMPMHFRGDADLNGVTEFDDFLILREMFGATRVQAAAIPEPSGLAVFAFALAALATIRRRRYPRASAH